MTRDEREIIIHFMRLVLSELHPNWTEYPIRDMRQKEDSAGEAFEDTEYENRHILQRAYFMLRCIEKLNGDT